MTLTTTQARPVRVPPAASEHDDGTRPRPGPSGAWARFLALHAGAWVLGLVAVLLRDTGGPACVVAFAYLTFFPGDALRAAFRVHADDVHLRLLLGVAGSVVTLLLVSLGASLLLGTGADGGVPALSAMPLMVGVTVVHAAGLVATWGARETAPGASPSAVQWLGWGLLALLADLTGMGAGLLDAGRGPGLTIAALGTLGALAVCAGVARGGPARALRPAVLFFLTLGVAWSFSRRTDNLYGFDVHQEYLWSRKTLDAGTWQLVPGDPYAAMLSVTSYPAALSSLTGMDVLDYFKVCAPMLLALAVTGAFLFARRYVADRVAFLVTCLLQLIPSALWQLPAVSRQEVALMLFAATVLLLFGAGGRGRGVQVFAALVASGMAVTHYTTSYVALATFTGALVLAVLLRLTLPWLRGTRRQLSVLVIGALAVSALGWNVVVTRSSVNVDHAAQSTQQTGLCRESSPLLTFLNGGNIAAVPPRDYFTETEIDAARRDWLVPYPRSLQDDLAAQAHPVRIAEHRGPVAALAPATEPLYVLLRQVGNVIVCLGVVFLALRLGRRRADDASGHGLEVLCVAVTALGLTAFTRLNAALAQTYNPERLFAQTAVVLAVPAGLLLEATARALAGRDRAGDIGSEDDGEHAPPARRPVRRLVPAVLAATVTALVVVDATGLHAAAVVKDAGNVQPDGEYARRYALTDADLAAAGWLGGRYRHGNMVFADTYGGLALQSEPAFADGLFTEISPHTLDQRAYVYATTENVEGGRVRLTKRSVRTVMTFPRPFIATYKSRYYSNGSAEVYR